MTSGMRTIIYPVTDLDAAKAVFSALFGSEPVMDEPYCHVDDVHAAVDALTAAGASVQSPARDVGGGTLVALLADADGNPIGLRQAR